MLSYDKSIFSNRIDHLNKVLSDDVAFKKSWDEFCADKEKEILYNQFFPFQFKGMSRLAQLIPWQKVFIQKASLIQRLNRIRCESHRELLLNILKNKC